MRVHRGTIDATGMRCGIVVSRFNDFVVTRLLDGALEAFARHGGDAGDVVVVWVPGSFEIPLAAQTLAASGSVDMVVCLGVVIRGDTPHFDYVAGEASRGVGAVSLGSGVPASFGVVTTDSLEQAIDRAGGKHGNKGADAVAAAVEMVSVLRSMRAAEQPPPGRAGPRRPR